jgi:hypothetical protein
MLGTQGPFPQPYQIDKKWQNPYPKRASNPDETIVRNILLTLFMD